MTEIYKLSIKLELKSDFLKINIFLINLKISFS